MKRMTPLLLAMLIVMASAWAVVVPAAAADPPGVVPALVRQEMKPGESITVAKRVTTAVVPTNPDIYFLADSTGSMGSAIDNVKANVDAIVASVLAAQPSAQFGAGNYKDFPITAIAPIPYPYSPYAFQHQQGITSNTTIVKNAITAWSASYGGDGSEGWLYALTKLATDPASGWRSGATKIVVIFGDAPAHDPVPVNAAQIIPPGSPEPPSIITEATTTAALIAADIKVIAISLPTGGYANGLDDNPTFHVISYTGYPGFPGYSGYVAGGTPGQASRIASATGGLYLFAPTADQVAAKILSGLQSFKTDVWATVAADPGLSVTLTPPVRYAVPSGTTVNFTETIKIMGTQDTKYCATVTFWANTYPKTGILIGTQTIEVGNLAQSGGNGPYGAPEVVSTQATVNGGATAPPIIKASWEQDLTISLEDGDPIHVKYMPTYPNAQFLPPLVKDGKKPVEFWAIVTDPDGVNTVLQGGSVFVAVYHPAGPPKNGSFKYQLVLQPVDPVVGLTAYKAACDAHLVTYQQNTTPPITDADILFEVEKGTASVWKVIGELDYEQPSGDYKAVYDAFDNSNVWASSGSPKTSLENVFTYVGIAGIELDFHTFNYGTVTVSSEKWIAGDTIWNMPLAPAPSPNPATVRSIGNTLVKITVKNSDMGFGFNGLAPTAYSGTVPPTSAQSNWNVVFDARMGSSAANAMYFDPDATVTLPNVLQLSSQDALDFSIHVKKSVSGVRSGTMWIGVVIMPWGG